MTITPELQTLITVLTILAGFIVNWWSNKNKISELRLSQKQLEQKYELDKQKADQDKKKSDADLSDQFLGIAEEAGKQVISRDLTIKELNDVNRELYKELSGIKASMATMQDQVSNLLVDKRKLEDESIRKDERISALELENQNLRDRVKILEDEVKTNSTTGGI